MHLGAAHADPGESAHGWFSLTDLPTGGEERVPVVVAHGEEDGPTLWVTGGVHGDEVTGVAVAQDVMREDLPSRLRGTVVCVPVVSPVGLRRHARRTYYGNDDPNRHFPDPAANESDSPEIQERISTRLYEAFADSADALVDLHCAQLDSVPFIIRDRILYGDRRTEAEAEELSEELGRLVEAFGFPAITEFPAEEYLDKRLQRSLAGAALNGAGIPAMTIELGGYGIVNEDLRAAGVAGVYGVMQALGMLEGLPEGVDEAGAGVIDAPVDYPVRRAHHPIAETGGLVRHRVEAGDVVEEGDPLADIVTPHGEVVETLTSGHDGYVVGRHDGLAAYEGDALATMAIRDEGDLVVPRDD